MHMELDIEHLLGAARTLDFPALLPLRGTCKTIRFLVDHQLATVNALDTALRTLCSGFFWQPPCSFYINSLPQYGTWNDDNSVSQWFESLPEECAEGLMPFTSAILSRILNFKGPVVLLGGAAKEVWWEIADMPVLTSMPEVAQAWHAWLEGIEEDRTRMSHLAPLGPGFNDALTDIAVSQAWGEEIRAHVAAARCLMQILVNRHHMTFTFLHAKLIGEFVKDYGPIAEIRQIFYEEPKYAPTHLLASTLL